MSESKAKAPLTPYLVHNSSGRKPQSPLALHSLNSEQCEAQLTDNKQMNPLLPSQQPTKLKRKTSLRNYKLYEGKTVFFCGGRFLTSRALWAFSVTLFLLIAPSVLFFIFTQV
jgi:hypothetical protein